MPVAAALALIACGTAFWHVPQMTSERLYLSLQEANQARLEAADFRLALWDGLLEISDLRLADPNCLTHDRIRVEHLRADLDPAALLRGRLAIRRLDVAGVRTHVQRAEPAAPIHGACGTPCLEYAPKLSEPYASEDGEPVQLERCLAHWPEIEQTIVRLGGLLEQLQSLDRFENRQVAPLSLAAIAQTDLTTLRHSRSSLGRRALRLSVASLRAESLDPAWMLGARATIHADQLSSHAAGRAEPVRFEIIAPSRATHLSGQYVPHQGHARWLVSLQTREIPVGNLLALASADQPMRLDGGQVSLTGTGWADASGFEMPLAIEAHDLSCQAQQRHDLAGIKAEHWAVGLTQLNQFAFDADCRGTWQRPRLHLDRQDIARRFRQDLTAAAQHELLAAMDTEPTQGAEFPISELAH